MALVLVPAVIGFLLGATRAGIASFVPWAAGIGYWIAASVGVWLCLFLGSLAARLILRPWHPPLLVVLALGGLLGSLPGRALIYSLADLLRSQVPVGRPLQVARPWEFSGEFMLTYAQTWSGVFLIWILAGLAIDRWLRRPLVATGFGQQFNGVGAESRPVLQHSPAFEALLNRLPADIGRNIVALEADDHYVRVHTRLGNALLLARLSETIEAADGLGGVRVHRSFWVRRNAVVATSARGKGLLLELENGLRIPVSYAYRESARQAGLI